MMTYEATVWDYLWVILWSATPEQVFLEGENVDPQKRIDAINNVLDQIKMKNRKRPVA